MVRPTAEFRAGRPPRASQISISAAKTVFENEREDGSTTTHEGRCREIGESQEDELRGVVVQEKETPMIEVIATQESPSNSSTQGANLTGAPVANQPLHRDGGSDGRFDCLRMCLLPSFLGRALDFLEEAMSFKQGF